MKFYSIGLALMLSATAIPAQAADSLPKGYTYVTTPTDSSPAKVKRKSLDLNDDVCKRVEIGPFEYCLYADTRQATIRGNKYDICYSWNENDDEFSTPIPIEEYEAAFPGGKLTVPPTVEYEGVTYTVVKIGGFGQNPFLKELELPETLLELESEAFYHTGLTKVRIPDSVIYSGYSVFNDCPFLTEVYIGKNLSELSEIRNSSVTSFTLHPDNEYFKASGHYILSKDGKRLVCNGNRDIEVLNNIPEGVEELNEATFCGLKKLRFVTLPSSLRHIHKYVFMDCPLLSEISLPEGLDIMHANVFSGTGIKELILPESLTQYIGEDFENGDMPYLEKLYIGKNVEYLGASPDYVPFHAAFMGCPNLKEVTIHPENRFYKVEGSNVYTKNGAMLCFSFGTGEVNSPINESVKWIGSRSFAYVDVNRITLPENLWRIDSFAFEGTNLKQPVTLPASVRYLENNFLFGYQLRDINVLSITPPSMQYPYDMAPHDPAALTVHVPQGCAESYSTTESWGKYKIVDDLPRSEKITTDFDYCGGHLKGRSYGLDTPPAEFAIRMTEEQMEAYKGQTISSVQFSNSWYRNYYAFVYRMSDDKVLARQDGFPCELNSWNCIAFSEPYVIDPADGDILIGYGAPERGQGEYSQVKHPDGNWFREIGDDWFQGFTGEDGAWMITVGLTGSEMPVDARVREITYVPVNTSGTLALKGKVENRTLQGLTECELTYTVRRANDTTPISTGSFTLTHDFLHYQEFMDFEVEIPLEAFGNLIVKLEVASVNGQPTQVGGSGSGPLQVQHRGKSEFIRNVVVEEATGTWCTYCPLGIAAIEQMQTKYADRFIPICLHDDEMRPDYTYESILNMFPGLPGSIVDRKEDLMPYPGFEAFETAYLQEADIAVCSISATAEFTNTVGSEITVDTQTTFGTEADGSYMIACAVLEDGCGPYEQQSNYSAEELGLDCDFDQMMYDNVARSIYYPFESEAAGEIVNTTPGTAQTHSLTFNTPENVNNGEALKVVAMVINRETGEIENACVTHVSPSASIIETAVAAPSVSVNGLTVTATGVQGPLTLLTPSGIAVARTNGTELNAPAPGLYILQTSGRSFKLTVR